MQGSISYNYKTKIMLYQRREIGLGETGFHQFHRHQLLRPEEQADYKWDHNWEFVLNTRPLIQSPPQIL